MSMFTKSMFTERRDSEVTAFRFHVVFAFIRKDFTNRKLFAKNLLPEGDGLRKLNLKTGFISIAEDCVALIMLSIYN